MEPERIELSARERERLKALHEVEQGPLKEIEAARRLRLSGRLIRRLQVQLRERGDRGIVRRLRGGHSNRKIPDVLKQRALRELRPGALCRFWPRPGQRTLSRARSTGQSREAARVDERSGIVAATGAAGESSAYVAASVIHVRRTGDEGQLALSLAGRTRPRRPSDCSDRRGHQPRVRTTGGA